MAWPRKDVPAGRIPLPTAIERYFQVALFLLVLTGFGTLASTGTLDAATVVLVGGALLVRGYFLSKRINAQIPALWTTYLTLAYGVFYFVDYTLLSRSFLTATVHLVLFGMVVRLYSVQKERDHVMLAVLAFLMVLAGAVLTVDSVFLFAFAGFMLMAVVTFVLMEMRRTSRTATVPTRDHVDAGAYRKMAFSLASTAPVLVALILVGAFGIFFLLPRTSAGYLSAFATGNDLSTGFSEHVQLGRIGQIQQSSAVVMHIQVDGDSRGLYDFKWRGVALGQFDGKTWSGPTEQFPLPRQPDGHYLLWPPSSASAREHLVRYRVLMEPIGSNVFFLAGRPRSLAGNYRLVAGDAAGSVFNLDEEHAISIYQADSDVAAPVPDELRRSSSAYPRQILSTYVGVPAHLDPRIEELARQVTSKSMTSYDKAEAISRYLSGTYRYTLELPQTEPSDPLPNFLFQRKAGHCEYFASSMAVMLRTLGIPTRIVNGFRTTEFNDLTSTYVVRASSAHSWVEVYFPEYGWVTFDPTPSAPLPEREGWNRMALYIDAMASFWREWVINYDVGHQRALGQNAMRGSRAAVEAMRRWAQDHYSRLLESARRVQRHMSRAPERWSGIGIAAMLVVLLLANLRALYGWLKRRQLRAHPEHEPRMAAALWYDRMTRRLAREGWQKLPVHTPREFLETIDEETLHEQVAEFTNAYEAARFGASSEEAQRLPHLYQEIVSTERK